MFLDDTIIVPMETVRILNIVRWTSIKQIIYNMVIAVAAVNIF